MKLETIITKIHSHSNLTNLDKIGENGEGHLTYNGSEIVGGSGVTINDTTPSKTTTYSSNKIDAQLNEIEEAVQSKINDTIAPLQTGYKIPVLTANPTSPANGEMWILKSVNSYTPQNEINTYSQASSTNILNCIKYASGLYRNVAIGFTLTEAIKLYDFTVKMKTDTASYHTANNNITIQLCEVVNNQASTVLNTKIYTPSSSLAADTAFDITMNYIDDNINLVANKEYCFLFSLVNPTGASNYIVQGVVTGTNSNLFGLDYYSSGSAWTRQDTYDASITIRKGV